MNETTLNAEYMQLMPHITADHHAPLPTTEQLRAGLELFDQRGEAVGSDAGRLMIRGLFHIQSDAVRENFEPALETALAAPTHDPLSVRLHALYLLAEYWSFNFAHHYAEDDRQTFSLANPPYCYVKECYELAAAQRMWHVAEHVLVSLIDHVIIQDSFAPSGLAASELMKAQEFIATAMEHVGANVSVVLKMSYLKVVSLIDNTNPRIELEKLVCAAHTDWQKLLVTVELATCRLDDNKEAAALDAAEYALILATRWAQTAYIHDKHRAVDQLWPLISRITEITRRKFNDRVVNVLTTYCDLWLNNPDPSREVEPQETRIWLCLEIADYYLAAGQKRKAKRQLYQMLKTLPAEKPSYSPWHLTPQKIVEKLLTLETSDGNSAAVQTVVELGTHFAADEDIEYTARLAAARAWCAVQQHRWRRHKRRNKRRRSTT